MTTHARMWAKEELKGHLAVVTTPFHEDGSIDFDSLEFNSMRAQELPCVSGLYINSIYNEPTALTLEERTLVMKRCLRAVLPGNISVVAIGGASIQDVIDLAQQAEAAGADMIILWPPTFGHRTSEGVLAYFEKVLGSVQIPGAIYRSGLKEFGYFMSYSDLSHLLKLPNFCAVKDVSMSLSNYLDTLGHFGDELVISCPLDEYWAAGRLLMPGKSPDFLFGTSRPLYCETPDRPYLSEFRSAINSGDLAAAESNMKRILAISNSLHTRHLEAGGHNVALIKKAIEILGYRCGAVREPMSLPAQSEIDSLARIFDELELRPW